MENISVLVDSFNLVTQNASGGVKVRIDNFVKNASSRLSIKKFDKWNDSVVNFDIVHIFKSSFESYTLMKYAQQNNVPVVVSSVVPSGKRLAIILNRVLCKLLPVYTDRYLNEYVLTHADALFAQTEKEKQFIIKHFHIQPEKITVIPNGISFNYSDCSQDLFREKTGITEDFVLQVGRFDANKNQLSIIEALKGTGIHLVFIGGADKEDSSYYDLCRLNADENVHFLGWVNHDDPLLKSAYCAAHTVVLPSHKEIFGNSLLEGGAFGANLVVSKVLPIEEWGLEDVCLTINPDSIQDIKEVLIRSMKQQKNESSMFYIRKKFSWDNVIEQHIAIYKSVLGRG